MREESGLRREVVRIGRLMYDRQLVVAAEGNLSTRLGGDLFLVTPAGLCKGMLAEADPVVVGMTDAAASAVPAGARPSSEWRLHREIYRVRSDVSAVCHGHPAWATAFAASGQALDGCLLPESVATLGAVPLAAYATPGTDEVPLAVRDLIAGHQALLLANHGVVTVGTTLAEAFFRLETVERLAQITLLARLAGGERRLSHPEVTTLLAATAGGALPSVAAGALLPCLPAEEPHGRGSAREPGGGSAPTDLDGFVTTVARSIAAALRRDDR